MNKRILVMMTMLAILVGIGIKFDLMSMNEKETTITSKFILGARPASVQKEVDAAFKNLKKHSGGWAFGGYHDVFYSLMGLNEAKIIKDIANQFDQKDIYLIDFGAGAGGWSLAAKKVIEKTFKDSNKHFHIISVTGSNEMETDTITAGNITLYNFSEFKLENIESELKKQGLDLTGKVNLIVAHYTLRHLVDPMGTLKQLYNLLIPKNGILLGQGFEFCLNNNETDTNESWKILTFVTHILFSHSVRTELNAFMILKKDTDQFEPPISYTGNVIFFATGGMRTTCAGDRITCFISDISFSGTYSFEDQIIKTSEKYGIMKYDYWGNEQSREVFQYIKEKDWARNAGE